MIGIMGSYADSVVISKRIHETFPHMDLSLIITSGNRVANGEAFDSLQAQVDQIIKKNNIQIIILSYCCSGNHIMPGLNNILTIDINEIMLNHFNRFFSHSCKSIGIVTRFATLDRHILKKKLILKNPRTNVYWSRADFLIPMVEEGWHRTRDAKILVSKVTHKLKFRQIDTCILGSSALSVFKNQMKINFKKKINIIDPTMFLSRVLNNNLGNDRASSRTAKGQNRIFFI